MSEAESDSVLIGHAARGDREALRKLLERFGPRVWSEINAQIATPLRAWLDADDVMQVTYLEAFLQVHRLESSEPAVFFGWLRTIANNNLRDAIRELGRQKRPAPARRVMAGPSADSYVALVELLGVTTTTPSRHAAGQEVQGVIESALQQLPADYATALRMYDLEGCDIDAVAAAMRRSPGAVHMLRSRAHDLLRVRLGAEANYFSDAR